MTTTNDHALKTVEDLCGPTGCWRRARLDLSRSLGDRMVVEERLAPYRVRFAGA